MKVNLIGVIPQQIESAKKPKINFGEKSQMPTHDDEFIPQETETSIKEKKQPSSFSKKLAKAVILIGSGILSYGTAKYAIHEISRLVAKYSKIKNKITLWTPKTTAKIHTVITEAISIASGFAGVVTAANISKQRKIRRSQDNESD